MEFILTSQQETYPLFIHSLKSLKVILCLSSSWASFVSFTGSFSNSVPVKNLCAFFAAWKFNHENCVGNILHYRYSPFLSGRSQGVVVTLVFGQTELNTRKTQSSEISLEPHNRSTSPAQGPKPYHNSWMDRNMTIMCRGYWNQTVYQHFYSQSSSAQYTHRSWHISIVNIGKHIIKPAFTKPVRKRDAYK